MSYSIQRVGLRLSAEELDYCNNNALEMQKHLFLRAVLIGRARFERDNQIIRLIRESTRLEKILASP